MEVTPVRIAAQIEEAALWADRIPPHASRFMTTHEFASVDGSMPTRTSSGGDGGVDTGGLDSPPSSLTPAALCDRAPRSAAPEVREDAGTVACREGDAVTVSTTTPSPTRSSSATTHPPGPLGEVGSAMAAGKLSQSGEDTLPAEGASGCRSSYTAWLDSTMKELP
jgi:hypothetical protein